MVKSRQGSVVWSDQGEEEKQVAEQGNSHLSSERKMMPKS